MNVSPQSVYGYCVLCECLSVSSLTCNILMVNALTGRKRELCRSAITRDLSSLVMSIQEVSGILIAK